MIAPIITVTYSIDKMGDGKSQALNTWLKEFVFNMLIQPFHCIIFLSIVMTGINIMDGTLSSSVLAVVMILFIMQAEKIVKTIFGFNKASSLGDSIAGVAALGTGLSMLQNAAGKAGSAKGALKGAKGGAGAGGKTSKKLNDMKNLNDGGASGEGRGTPGGEEGNTPDGNGGTPDNPSPNGDGGNNSENRSRLKNVGSTIGKGALKGAKGLGKGLGKGYAAMLKQAPGIALGAMMLPQGGMAAYGGYKAGQAISNKAQSVNPLSDANKTQRIMQNNERYLASAHQEYQNNTGLSNEEMVSRSNYLLNADIDNLTDDDDIKYASHLQALEDCHDTLGAEDPGKEVLRTVKQIQRGNIKPKD